MNFKTLKIIFIACAALFMPSLASAVTVSYAGLGGSVGPSFSSGGITVTGSDDIFVTNFGSIGVGDVAMDAGETINFAFDMPATNVSYTLWFVQGSAPFGHRTVEAFGVGGASLGTATQFGDSTHNVSSLFGNTVIESFSLTASPDSLFGISAVSYEVSAVPLPAALPLYGAGLTVMGFLGWRKKRKSAA